LYSVFGLIIFPFSQTELKTFVESSIIAHLTCHQSCNCKFIKRHGVSTLYVLNLGWNM
jgi:ribosomal protein L36